MRQIQSTTLIILGEELIPSEVTELLGIEPVRSSRKGVVPTDVRPDGTLRFPNRPSKSGMWKLWIEDIFQLPLEQQIDYWAGKLEQKKQAFDLFSERGYEVYLDCHIDPDSTTTYELKPELLSRISSANAVLSITVARR